ncbi:DUF4255 domain-containing protein [Dokdonia sp.]|uniref:DUF4255 domain-containing protein n=1 Tax=Dokdonia sp. TaxID=2024995 RepID=UPI003267AE33
MIQEAFQYTRNVFNQFIKNKFGVDEDAVVINTIVDQSGAIPVGNQNKIIMSLIHIEQETVKPFYTKNQKVSNGNYVASPQTERYNIYVLVTSYFDDYNETLKFLNASIQFFQEHQSLDATINSDLPKGLQKLNFDLQKGGDYMQMHNLWSALGAKYQPSVIYKMRLVTIASTGIDEFVPKITKISNRSTL